MTEALKKTWAQKCAEFIEKRDAWMQTKLPWWNDCMSILKDKFITPGDRFLGEEFAGSWIHPAWHKYSKEPEIPANATVVQEEKILKRRSDALAKAKAEGISSEEVAVQLAPQMGMDTRDAEDILIETFRNLRKRELNAQFNGETSDEKKHVKLENREAQLEYGESLMSKLKDAEVNALLKKLSSPVDANGTRRVDWIDTLFANGELELTRGRYRNADGKRGCLINGVAVHELVYKYAAHLKSGGKSLAEAVKLYRERREAGRALQAMRVESQTVEEHGATGTENNVPF